MPSIWTELSAEPLLTAAEETTLGMQMEAGLLARSQREHPQGWCDASPAELEELVQLGQQARQRFISANLRLVAMVARPAAARSGLSEMDLFQEGCLGLIRAVERFDYRRGRRFSTYALFWVRAFVGAATANRLGAMNLPAGRAGKLRALRGAEVEMAQLLGRHPTASDLAEHLGRPQRWVAELMAHSAPQPVESIEGLAADVVDPETPDRPDRDATSLVHHLLGRLPDLERQVLMMRTGFLDSRRSYVDIAGALGISVQRVRQTEARALDLLRDICPQSAAALL